MISTTPPVVTTSRTPFAIVKSPDKTVVTKPVDIGIPVAQTACGVQILSGMLTRFVYLTCDKGYSYVLFIRLKSF